MDNHRAISRARKKNRMAMGMPPWFTKDLQDKENQNAQAQKQEQRKKAF